MDDTDIAIGYADAAAEEIIEDLEDDDVLCVNAHDRCYGGSGGPCPYCERKV